MDYEIAHLPHSQPINLLVENAGIMAADYAVSPQGHEISFATNVLGHFALRRGILEQDLLAHNARMIIVTGDIYVLSKKIAAPIMSGAGGLAVCKPIAAASWVLDWPRIATPLPVLSVFMVHPGVRQPIWGAAVMPDTDNGRTRLWDGFTVTAEMGAVRICWPAPKPAGYVCHGSYYHNVHGEAELANDDPAMNDIAACALWERCLQLSAQSCAPIYTSSKASPDKSA